MGLLRKFFSNTGKPEGVMGRIVVAMMNRGHAGIAAWGFTHLRFRGDEDVLDCGCGGGANLAQLLRRGWTTLPSPWRMHARSTARRSTRDAVQ